MSTRVVQTCAVTLRGSVGSTRRVIHTNITIHTPGRVHTKQDDLRAKQLVVFPSGVFDRATRECFCGGSSEPRCQSDRRRSRWSVPSRQETLRSRPSIRPTKSGSQRSITGWPAAGPRRGRFKNANLPHGASAARRSRRIARPVRRPCEAYVFVRPNAPGDDLPSPVFSATMPRGTSHGAARLLELELDQAGERRTRHASRAHSPRTPIALALFMPPASVGVCRERRRLRWSRCASRARATRRSCSASA